jgi:hypothetical protein
MRINWVVPIRGLIKAIAWLAREIWTWVEIIVSAPIVTLLYLLMLMIKGANVITKKVRRMMKPADYTLSEISVTNIGCFIGTIDELEGDKAIFLDFPSSIKMTKHGMILKDEKGVRYLIKTLSQRQKPAHLAKLLADKFLDDSSF